MTSVAPKQGSEPSAFASSLDTFCANLSRGLHATAQPLTILQASLGMDTIGKMTAEELRSVVRISAGEVQRVCNYFNLLKQFVQVERARPELVPLPLEALLREAVEGLSLVFQDGGIKLQLDGTDTSAYVLVHQPRIRQAFSGVLLLERALAAPGDTVELVVTPFENVVKVSFRNVQPAVRTLNEEMSLKLALVEANVRSQNGVLHWDLEPLTVDIELKRAPGA